MSKKIDIHVFLENARAELRRQGFSKSSQYSVNPKWRQLLKYAGTNKITSYTPEIGALFSLHICGKTLDDSCWHLSNPAILLRRSIRMLDYFYHTGVIPPHRHKNVYLFPPQYHNIAERFLEYRRTQIKPSSLIAARRHLGCFMDFMIGRHISHPSRLKSSHISEYCKTLAGYDNCTIHTHLCNLRAFLQWMRNAEIHTQDLSQAIPKFRLYQDAHIPTTWSPDEVRRLLAAVDRANPLGKRNYAMLVMVAILGIRIGDLLRLKLENLDWREKRITYIQEKTGTQQCLPITEEVGTALIDYLRNGRPDAESRYVFIKHLFPFQPFSEHNSFWTIFCLYMTRAGLSRKKRVGMHSLRHSLATTMLRHKFPMPVIANVLGHAHLRTTTGYLKVDIDQLRQCCLSFDAMGDVK